MNNNLDFLNKVEVNSFVYSSVDKDNIDCKSVVIDGRAYTKWGRLQIVTFVGTMFEAKNKDTGMTEYFVTVGVSKQHPTDLVHDKKTAIEVARENSLMDPIMVMYNVSESFDTYAFKNMMDTYHSTMKLEMIMTREEKKKKLDESFKKDWEFYLNKQ